MKCPSCKSPNDNKLTICEKCGRFSCDHCQKIEEINPFGSKKYLCPHCNTKIVAKSDSEVDFELDSFF